MGFYSYIQYKKCFDWAYGGSVQPGTCTMLVENGQSRIFADREGAVFCVKND